jgi:hypothetical protein
MYTKDLQIAAGYEYIIVNKKRAVVDKDFKFIVGIKNKLILLSTAPTQ